jgi:signal transduction histidine kinase
VARRSLRSRLAIALIATAIVSVGVTAIVSVGLVRNYAQDSAQRDLEHVASRLAEDPGVFGEVRSLRAIGNVLHGTGYLIGVALTDGTIRRDLAGASGRIDVGPLASGQTTRGTTPLGGEDYAYYGIPVVGAPPVAGLILARPVAGPRELWRPIVARVLLAGLAAVLAAAVLSALLARRLVRPLRDVASAAERIAAGDLDQRVAVESDDEVGEMAASFNSMAAGLAEAQRREREFLASVSHELRTPLTAIRGYAEALTDDAIRDGEGRARALGVIRSEAGRLERLVQDVMDLARLGAKTFELHPRDVDLAAGLRDAAAAHGAQAAGAEVRLAVEIPESLPARTDPDRVRQVVSNLLENAIRVTPGGGSVRLAATTVPGGVVIEVADTGPGIRPADRPHVFERSYLWRASRDHQQVGTGLGLAIVRELVQALGGTVEVESEVDAGTIFRVKLPAHHPAPARV